LGFEVFTYASAVEYFPEFYGNRAAHLAGDGAFSVTIEPMNAAEATSLAMADSGQGDAVESTKRVLASRIKEVRGFSLRTNSGEVVKPKTGKELVDVCQKLLDASTYGVLVSELFKAVSQQSVLKGGVLDKSASPQE